MKIVVTLDTKDVSEALEKLVREQLKDESQTYKLLSVKMEHDQSVGNIFEAQVEVEITPF